MGRMGRCREWIGRALKGEEKQKIEGRTSRMDNNGVGKWRWW